MYAIMNVVFGVAWELGKAKTRILDEAAEEELDGFEAPYNGGGDGWGYFGIDLPASFDESSLTYIDEMDLTVTPALRAKYDAMVAALDPALKSAVTAMGPARLVIVPSTS